MRTPLALLAALLCFTAFSATAFAKDVVDARPFDKLLKKYVDEAGAVDYKGWKASKEDGAALDAFVAAVGTAKVAGDDKAKLAFYVNAYNAIVLDEILEEYPLASVMKVDGFFKTRKHKVAGKELTLDQLENEVIRKQFAEPRIHFVLVCGAKSCPPLRRKAATAANIEGLLESSAKRFIPRATKVKDGAVTTSKLFEWFAGDFEKSDGSVAKYLARYVPKHKDAILADGAKLAYSHYSWKLNEQ